MWLRRDRGLILAALTVTGTLALGSASASAGTFPGSNGKIAFARGGDGDSQIFVMDPDGANQTPLTRNSVEDGSPSFSGDGERIALAGLLGSDEQIFAMDANGQHPAQLTFGGGEDPAFSASGRQIAFENLDGVSEQIFVMNADGSNQIPLTTGSMGDDEPSWSPDGQRIAFIRFDGSDEEIYVMNADGSNQIPLTNDAVDDADPSWSPDGQRIVFARGGEDDPATEIYVMNSADGSNQTPLTNNGVEDGDPVFSPDGLRIAFTREEVSDGEIYVMNSADGSNQIPLTSNAVDDEDPAWQPLNAPACDLTGTKKQKSLKFVKVKITCNEDATVTAGGKGKAPKVLTRSAAGDSAVKKFGLKPKTVDVQPNQTITLKLKVSGKGRKALTGAANAGKKGTATVTTTSVDDLGLSSSDSKKVGFKRKG